MREICTNKDFLTGNATAVDGFEVLTHEIKHENILVDKLRLNQILLNLLLNACKYTPDGGHIVFSVTELPRRSPQLVNLRFVVQDNGYGMTEEYVATIFDAFTREESSVTFGTDRSEAFRSGIRRKAIDKLIIRVKV